MRAIWKGTVSFGLVTVPVGLHSALEPKGELAFRLLHRKDASPIDYRRFCEKENVEVEWAEIVKGYEHAKGKYVVLDDKDFARARVEATHTVPRSRTPSCATRSARAAGPASARS